MHPLIPDEYTFRSLADDRVLAGAHVPRARTRCTSASALERGPARRRALLVRRRAPGRDHAAQLPALPAAAPRPDGELLDLAAIDILRTRERGVPRYNEFRRLFHLKPAETFEELTRRRGRGRRARARLRRRRAGRPDGRALRRAEAEGLRLQRHGLPRLHPDGVAAAREPTASSPTTTGRRSTRRPGSTGSRRTACAPCCCGTSRSSRRRSRASTNPFAPWKRVPAA